MVLQPVVLDSNARGIAAPANKPAAEHNPTFEQALEGEQPSATPALPAAVSDADTGDAEIQDRELRQSAGAPTPASPSPNPPSVFANDPLVESVAPQEIEPVPVHPEDVSEVAEKPMPALATSARPALAVESLLKFMLQAPVAAAPSPPVDVQARPNNSAGTIGVNSNMDIPPRPPLNETAGAWNVSRAPAQNESSANPGSTPIAPTPERIAARIAPPPPVVTNPHTGPNRSATTASLRAPNASSSSNGEINPPVSAASVAPFALEHAQPPPSPAAARAAHVDAAIRLENLQSAATNVPAFLADQPAVSAPNVAPGPAVMHLTPNLAEPMTPLAKPATQEVEAPFTNQVSRGLNALLQQRGGSIHLRLDPPDLGELRVQMTISRGVVSAEFHAASPQAHALLEKSLASLRMSLEHQGLNVDRLSVAAHATSGSSTTRHDSNQQGNFESNQRPHHDASGGESRGRREHAADQSPRHYSLRDFESVISSLNQSPV